MKHPEFILAPGLHGGSSHLKPLAALLARHNYSVKCLTLPNDSSSTLSDYTRFLRSQLPKKSSCVLVAESFSSLAALSLASQKPHGLHALVLLGGFPVFPLPTPLRILAKLAPALPFWATPLKEMGLWALLGRDGTSFQRKTLVEEMKASGAATLAGRIKIAASANLVPILANITVPVLAIRGTHDRLIGKNSLEKLRGIPKYQQVEVSGAHIIAVSNKSEVAKLVKKFLSSLKRKTGR